MSAHDATLRFEADHSVLTLAGSDNAGGSVRLAISPQALAQRLWPHGVPGSGPIERAIDEIETAIEASPLRHAVRGQLALAADSALGLPGRPGDPGPWSRDEVEAQFNAFVASPARLAGDSAAALVLVRELLHHLGFASLALAD